MNFNIITIFPEFIENFKKIGFIDRAIQKKIISIKSINLRDFSSDKHKRVDDRPYGGGPGMVLQYEPIEKSLLSLNLNKKDNKVIYLSPQGETLTQKKISSFLNFKNLTLICGRYEGIDQRAVDSLIDEEISVGDYVVSGGEIPSMLLVEGICRLIPGTIDDGESTKEESFQNNLLDFPHFTRPELINNKKVPEVLLKGNHLEINKWRRKQALGATWLKRPELLKNVKLSEEDDKLLSDYISEFKKR
ncbi:MAG: tRNA (guanosine(37)-N1)-methyltransferase TrmD [Pseudomonadota bacterium]|nr:tRNA (guanosine(37)-N1)-methyltransferase TrmD [Pseudomonadota bacterium]